MKSFSISSIILSPRELHSLFWAVHFQKQNQRVCEICPFQPFHCSLKGYSNILNDFARETSNWNSLGYLFRSDFGLRTLLDQPSFSNSYSQNPDCNFDWHLTEAYSSICVVFACMTDQSFACTCYNQKSLRMSVSCFYS